jgi:hypothetical protein
MCSSATAVTADLHQHGALQPCLQCSLLLLSNFEHYCYTMSFRLKKTLLVPVLHLPTCMQAPAAVAAAVPAEALKAQLKVVLLAQRDLFSCNPLHVAILHGRCQVCPCVMKEW